MPPAEPLDPVLRYQLWVLQDMRTRDELYRQRLSVSRLAARPVISIVTPVYDTPPAILRRMLASVQEQTYPYWQHCLVDDGSSEAWIAPALERAAAADPRIVVRRRAANGGIVEASNDALNLATSDFVALLDHDDELHPEALFETARVLNAQPDVDVVYSDCDVIEADGLRGHPFFFPDWSPELLLALPYVVHLTVFRRALLQLIGGFRPGLEGAQDYDLALRTTAASAGDRIAHIPRVLYHWRVWEQSAARNPAAKPYAYAARRRASLDYMHAQKIEGELRDLDVPGYHMLKFAITGDPRVNVVVPVVSADGVDASELTARLVRVLASGGHDNYDLTIVGPRDLSIDSGVKAGRAPITFMPFDGPLDAGAMVTAGAAYGAGQQILALGADVASGREGWLSAMLEFAQQKAIGAVGGRIFAQNGGLWHAGIVVPQRTPRCVQREGFVTANYLAVSGACLLTRRLVWETAGGFQESSTVGFPDVDYCLRVWSGGHRIVYMPAAELRTAGEAVRDPYADDAAGQVRFEQTWRDRLERDPYYNPNYTDDGRFLVRLA